jgi:N-acyl-D-amino-acid deacylase
MRGLYSRGISPTAYGLYPHYIRTFVKEQGILSLEGAIQKATSLPAQEVLGLGDRGVLKEGAYADIVVFDLGAIREGEDFLEPAQPPEGIEHVLVNGTVVYEGRTHTGRRPGRVLRRS